MTDRILGEPEICPDYEGGAWRKRKGNCGVFPEPEPGLYTPPADTSCTPQDQTAYIRSVTVNPGGQDKSSTCPRASNRAGLVRRKAEREQGGRFSLRNLLPGRGRR